MEQNTPSPTSPHETEVLFNADCPVCNFEIKHYSKYAADSDLAIRFDDLNACELARWGLDADTAARRLHIRHHGQVLSGIDAFVVLWGQMPRYRKLARLIGVPGIRHLATFAYDYILAPTLYVFHLRRLKRNSRQHPT